MMTGKTDPRLSSFDEMMTAFMAEKGCPGAAVAVGNGAKVLYSRGFGQADVENRKPVLPTSRFRIASVSKPFTAVAILQLAEKGKLKLSDKVFSILKAEPLKGQKPDPRLKKVTILHLLYHTGGWDRGVSFDPMFRPVQFAQQLGIDPPAGPDAIVQCMMGVPLDFEPGERYAYSNFGYCLLGRVIEKLTGQTYEQYVRQNILVPLGIKSMQIGRTLPAGRARNEVRYYDHLGRTKPSVFKANLGEKVPLPYGTWYIEAMDSHGAWIASAPDLVKFANAFNDPATCKVLSAASVKFMFAPPKGPLGHNEDGSVLTTYYGCGWRVRPVGVDGSFNAWHGGALAGTSTLLVRRHDGLNWAVLFNSRLARHARQALAGQVDPLMHKAADAVKEWPK